MKQFYPNLNQFMTGFKTKSYFTKLLAFAIFTLFSLQSNALDYYSVASGDWNDPATWSATSGGGPGASVPITGDNVFIEGGFTVTITANAAATNVSIVAGSFLVSNTITLTISANFDNNGTFTANGGTVNIGGNWNNTGTFNAGTGIVNFINAAATQNLNAGTGSFNNLTHNAGGTLELISTDLIVSGTLTNSAGTFNTNGFNLTVNTSLTISGGTFSGTSGNITTLNLSLSNGTLVGPSGNFYVSGNWAKTTGTFTPGTNTVTFTGASGTQSINSNSNPFNNVTHTGAGVLQIGSTNMVTGGTFINEAGAGNFNANALAHTVTGLTTINGGTYLASTGSQNLNGGLTINGGAFTGSTGIVNTTNLILNAGATLTAPTATFSIRGNWQNNGGTFIPGTFTTTFNGTIAQTIGGTSSTSFNNLTIGNTSNIVSLAVNSTVSSVLTINASSNLNLGSFDLYLTGPTTPLVRNGTLTTSTSTVYYSNAAAVNVIAINYYNLNLTGGARTLANTGTIGVANIFTPGAGAFTITGSTVIFNGSVNQNIPALTYNNLQTATSGTKSLVGNTTVNAVLTVNAGSTIDLGANDLTFTATGTTALVANNNINAGTSTVYYTNTSTVGIITGTANFYNLNLTGGPRTNLGTIGIANVLTPGTVTTLGGTVSFNGTGNQNIPALSYAILQTATSGTKSLVGNTTVSSTLTVNSGSTIDLGSNTLTLSGAGVPLVVNGIFIGNSSTVIYSNSAATTIAAVNYYNLTNTNNTAANTRIIPNGGTVGIANTFIPNTGGYTITGSTVNFNGTVGVQTFTPAFTFNNLTLSNAAGLNISSSITVNTALQFNNGRINTGAANTVTLTNGASVTGAGPGQYVNGFLRKGISAGLPNINFEIGDNNYYTPVLLDFTGITNATGSILAKTTAGDHPEINYSEINPSLSANRFWTLTNTGVTATSYSATFNFDASNVDGGANPSSFVVNRYVPSTWTTPVLGTVSATSTQASSLLLSEFGDFQLGEETAVVLTACAFGANTSSGINVLPCIDLPTNEMVVSTVFACNQYFTMDVIKGLTYRIYTGNTTSPASPLTMSVYDEAFPANPAIAFSASNVGNPVTAVANNVYLSFTSPVSGKLRILINKKRDCAAVLPASLNVRINVVSGSNTEDNELTAGTDSWIGHIFDATNAAVSFNGTFSNYLGYYNQTENFNETFGGNNDITCVSNINSAGTLRASVKNKDFSVRYRMNSTKKGLYTVSIGSDDGSRLAVDGTLVYNDWVAQGYAPVNGILMSLTGTSNLLLDFYEGAGGNQVSFLNFSQVLANQLSTNTSQTICQGTTVNTISGDVFPGTLLTGLSTAAYQWTYSTTPGGIRTNITGATGATFAPSTLIAPFNLAGTYYIFRNARLTSSNNLFNPNTSIVLSNESNAATLIVVASAPVFTATALSSSICNGNGTDILLSSSTIGINYQLRNNVGNVNIGSPVAGTGGPINLPTGPLLVTTTFNVLAANSVTLCEIQMTGTPIVTVNQIPSMTSSTTGTVCSGVALTFGLTSTIPSTYQWIATDNPNTTGENFSTLTTSGTINNTIVNLTAIPQVVTYTVTPTSTTGTCIGDPQTVQITVNPRANMTSAGSATVCSGTAVNIPLTSDVASTYTWIAAANGGVTGESTTTQSTSTLLNTLINTTTSNQIVTYTVTPSSTPIVCPGTAQTVLVTVRPQPALTSTATPAAICSGSTFSYTPASTVSGATFTWTRAAVAGISEAAVTIPVAGNISEVLTNTTAAPVNVIYVYSVSVDGCTNPTNYNVTVAVNPKPLVTSLSGSVCSGLALSYALTANVGINNYKWIATDNPNTTGENFSTLITSGTINNTIVNLTATPQVVSYTVTATANTGSCIGDPQTVLITVNPRANMTSAGSATVCSGTAVNIPLTSDVTSTYTWIATANGNVTGESTTTQSTSTLLNTLINTTTTNQTVTYTVTPTSTPIVCPGTAQTVLVTVRPQPALTSTLTPAAICSGSTFNYTATSNVAAATFTWTRAAVAGISEAAVSIPVAGNISEVLTNTTAAPVNVVYVYSVTVDGCTNPTTYNVTVTVRPTPTATISGNSTVCIGSPNQIITFTNPQTLPVTVTYNVNGGGNTTINIGASTTATVTRSGATAGTFIYNLVNVFYQTAPTCINTISGTATVFIVPTSTITRTSAAGTTAQSVCTNNPITDITYNIVGSGAAPTVGGLPAGVTYAFNAGVLTISGSPSVTGSFTYTITTAGPCPAAGPNSTGTITVVAIATGSLAAGETSGPASNDNEICSGAPVTFTATAGYTSYRFYINGIVAQNAGPSNIFSTTSLINGDVVSVEVFNSLSCPTFFNTVTISVLPLPIATLVANTTTICPTQPVTFTASPAGLSNYVFKVNGVQVQSGLSTTFTSTTLNNNDSVTVTIRNANNCEGVSPAVYMTVNPSPAGTLTATENSGQVDNNTICIGASVLFTATGGNTYQFKVNNVIVQPFSAVNTFTGTPAVAGPYVVQVDVISAFGCPATYPAVVIDVTALPTGTLSAFESSNVANDNIICTGTLVTFTAPASFSNYLFKLNGATVQNSVSNIYTNSTLIDNDIITVEVTNGVGCTGVLNPQQITVTPSPSGTLTASANPACSGSNVTFTATAGFANYIFSVGGTVVQNNATNTYSSSAITNGQTVSVSVTNNSTCSAPFNDIVMNVNPLPTGSIVITENSGTINNNSICIGDLATFTATSGFSNYDFRVNTVSVQNGVSNIFSSTTLTNGASITVEVTDLNGCKAILSAALITVTPLPVLSAITGSTTFCANGTTTLISSPVGGVWSSSNTAIATVNASTGVVTGIAAGSATITYTYTNANGCTSAVSTLVTTNPFPIPTLSGPNPICPETAGNIYITEAGQTNYVWTVVGGTIDAGGAATDNFVSVTWDNVPVKTINVNYTNSYGCTSSTSSTFTNAPSTPPPTIIGTNIVCVNTTGIVYTTESGKFNYTWAVTGGTVTAGGGNSDNTITITWNTAGVQSVSVNYNEAGGCTAASPTIWPVTVNPLPTASVSGTTAVCQNAPSPNITFTGASGTAPYTFTYTVNAGALQTIVASANSINIPVPTVTPGSYIYSLVSVQDNSSTSCSQLQTGSATVTVNPLPTLNITNPPIVCAPASENLTLPSVTATSTSGLTFTYWTNAAATIAYPSPTAAAAGTYYIKGTTAEGCYVIQPVVVSQNPLPTASISGTIAVCENAASPNITFTGASGTAPYTFTYKINGGANQTIVAPVNSINIAVSTIIPGTYIYSLVSVQDGSSTTCSQLQTGSVTVTVNPLPTLIITNPAAVCTPSTVNLTLAAVTAGSTAGLTYSYWTNAAATIAYATPTTAGAGTYFIKGTTVPGCSTVQPVVVTVNALPATPIVTPATAAFCLGNIQPLNAGTSFVTNTISVTTGNVNVTIPDNNATGIGRTLSVSGVPAGAVINSIAVTFNITHATPSDLVINLKAPNGNVLNLVNREGGIINNFTNTIISSNAVTSIVGQAAPFTGTYKPEATVGVAGAGAVAGNTSNASSFNSLFDVPNGNWIFSVRDAASGNAGTSNNWSIAINYSLAVTPAPITWSPLTDLYTDPAATIAYTGQNLAAVYARPATAGTKVYTATATNAAGCTAIASSTLTVNPVPVVSISGDYCTVPGKVRLTAVSVPAGASFVWSNGQTGPFIDVDIADSYDVVASFGTGCSATATSSVAQELVINGDFSAGNTGFITGYAYKPDLPGVNNELVPDQGIDGYGVGTNGQNYHPNFYGMDHTNNQTGDRNFMLVNGHGNLTIWQQTVTVLPNTDYYFSAYAMNLNPASPAQLRFEVNGVQVGTTADLNTAPKPTNNDQVNLANWVRFYSNPSWNSGNATSAVIRIVNLNNAAGGNDFGLDDISFGTLSTFITVITPPQTVNQTVCVNSPIEPISYNLGGSGSAPVISSLPSGITATFNGVNLTLSGTPTIAGIYPYSIATTGCNPFTASGVITVQSQTVNLSAGPGAQTVCTGDPIADITYTIAGTATAASITAGTLPAGVTGSFAGNNFTISGTPTVTGVYSYTISTSGASCAPASISGTITVQEQSIVNTSGSISQTLCVNKTIETIIYTAGPTVTGATVTGLPTGVTGQFVSGLFIISGTPSVLGNYTYTVTTSGSCDAVSVTGNINVQQETISLVSATASQNICIGTPMQDIVFNVGGLATNASVSGLPTGVNGSYSAGLFTISGTPTQSGTFNYIITTSGGGCAVPATISGTLSSGSNTWYGLYSTNWSDASNWACGTVPIAITNVIISTTATRMPQLTTASVCRSLELQTGTTLDLNGNNFTIAGAVSGPGIFKGSASSGITLNGVSAVSSLNFDQSVDGASNALNNLTITGVASSVTLANKMAIYGALSPEAGTLTLNDNLVLRSSATATARVGVVTGTIVYAAAGKFTVERYISEGRKWRFLSVPTNNVAQTFKQAWQEGSTTASGNPNPGYGFLIGYPNNSSYTGLGFDFYAPGGHTVKTYNSITDAWVGIGSTNNTMKTQTGYMSFVTGNRLGSGTTIARTAGPIYIGTQPAIPVAANQYVAIGNPYASPVILNNINKTGIQNLFVVWDPKLGGSYGLGAYQYIEKAFADNVYRIFPGGGSYGPSTSVVTNLESGQAFFVRGTTGGNLQFEENDKGTGSQLVFREPNVQRLRANLFAVQPDSVRLVDGVMTRYNNGYSNEYNNEDVLKVGNTNETLSIQHSNKQLVIDNRQKVYDNDTIHIKMSGLRVQNYKWVLTLENLETDGFTAFLLDKHLQTSTPLNMNGTTEVGFNVVNTAGSYAADRFKIVFKMAVVLPVNITSISANRNNDKTVSVNWKVQNELNLTGYEVQRSTDGRDFASIITQSPEHNQGGAVNYKALDRGVTQGDLFYRIKANSISGQVQYSAIVKVSGIKTSASISVYPNPVTGKQMQVRFTGVETGNYQLVLVNAAGQIVYKGTAVVNNGASAKSIQLSNDMAGGRYHLTVTAPDGTNYNQIIIME